MTTSIKQTLGSDSTLKQYGNDNTELHLSAEDIRFFSELIDEDLEASGDLLDDEAEDFILETQNVFDSAVENVIHDEELITVSLTEEQKDYFFYDLLQGIMYERTAPEYLEDDMQDAWDAMEGCWMQVHPDHETRAEQIARQEKEDAENEAYAKSHGFNSSSELFGYRMAILNGQIVETSKFGSIAEYREYKAAKIEAAIKSRKN